MFHLLISKDSRAKNLKGKEISNGILWVHGIVHFIKKNSTTIYYPKKTGFLTPAIAYLTIFLYFGFVYLLYDYTKWALLLYLIPVFTNLYYILKYNYAIRDRPKKEKRPKK